MTLKAEKGLLHILSIWQLLLLCHCIPKGMMGSTEESFCCIRLGLMILLSWDFGRIFDRSWGLHLLRFLRYFHRIRNWQLLNRLNRRWWWSGLFEGIISWDRHLGSSFLHWRQLDWSLDAFMLHLIRFYRCRHTTNLMLLERHRCWGCRECLNCTGNRTIYCRKRNIHRRLRYFHHHIEVWIRFHHRIFTGISTIWPRTLLSNGKSSWQGSIVLYYHMLSNNVWSHSSPQLYIQLELCRRALIGSLSCICRVR